MTFPDQIRRIAKSSPEKPCVIAGDRTLTFAEVDRRSDLAADAWLDAGIAYGDRVAVLAMNEIEFIEWQIAAQRAGVILVPLNARFQVAELQGVIDDCRPRLLICGNGFEDAADRLQVESVWRLGSAHPSQSYDERLRCASLTRREIADPDALASLLYTSGTTGAPKGAMISNKALMARALALSVDLQIRPNDTFLQTLPMFHLAQTFSCAFSVCGATNVMMASFDAGTAIAAIERYRISCMLVVPTIIKLLVEHSDLGSADLSSLRSVFYGGSSISTRLLTQALDALRCDFYQMYGMTETGPATLLRPSDHDPSRPELLVSAGTDIVTLSVGIEDESGRCCSPGQQGEIVIGGPTLMSGY